MVSESLIPSLNASAMPARNNDGGLLKAPSLKAEDGFFIANSSLSGTALSPCGKGRGEGGKGFRIEISLIRSEKGVGEGKSRAEIKRWRMIQYLNFSSLFEGAPPILSIEE
jgi:hypothetical protein